MSKRIDSLEIELNEEGWMFYYRLPDNSIIMSQEIDETHKRWGILDSSGEFKRIPQVKVDRLVNRNPTLQEQFAQLTKQTLETSAELRKLHSVVRDLFL